MDETPKEELRMEEKLQDVIPEVLVIGAGIAGMQAALDIAEKGFKVHLVEKDPSIGGHMAQLDKTFPTLDCSACIITPKMVDTANHPNINLLTYSEVVHIEGKAGHFKVILRKKPRYVDGTKCTACADCVAQCPVTLPNEFDMGLGEKRPSTSLSHKPSLSNIPSTGEEYLLVQLPVLSIVTLRAMWLSSLREV